MSEEAVKEVKVVLSNDAELKALTGEKKPRRRGTRKIRGGAAADTEAIPESGRVADVGGSLSPLAASVAEGPVARIEKINAGGAPPTGIQRPVSGEGAGAPLSGGGAAPASAAISPLAVKLSDTPPTVTLPVLSTTSAVGGGAAVAGILIGNKKGKPTVSTVPIAKIIPTKRRLGAAPPAQSLKKPKFKINGTVTSIEKVAPRGEVSNPGSPAPNASKITRRFKARHINLTVKSARASKAVRRDVKTRVRNMSLADVRKVLLSKGIIKSATAEKLPEIMLRNMLRDYMLLHNAD